MVDWVEVATEDVEIPTLSSRGEKLANATLNFLNTELPLPRKMNKYSAKAPTLLCLRWNIRCAVPGFHSVTADKAVHGKSDACMEEFVFVHVVRFL